MANIDIAGKLNAATTEGYVADAEQVHYANGNVAATLEKVETAVDDLTENGRNWYRYGAVRASKLFSLTTAATSEDIKAALTDIAGNHPKQAGLDACITGHMWLTEYVMGGVVMVGWSGQGYVLTYVGQLTPAPDVWACSITLSATDDEMGRTTYGVVKNGTCVRLSEVKELSNRLTKLQESGTEPHFSGLTDGVTPHDGTAQTPHALYFDLQLLTFVCLDEDGYYYTTWNDEETDFPMSAYVVEPGGRPHAGRLFYSENDEAYFYYSADLFYKLNSITTKAMSDLNTKPIMKYKVVKRRNPATAGVKYYAIPVVTATMTLDDVARSIERSSTVSTADVKAALDALENEVLDALRHGFSVRLGDLGSFRPTFKTGGTETADEFVASMIERVHVTFTPSTRMKQELDVENLSFERYEEEQGI